VVHWLAGIVVAVSGMLSGIFVVTVNAWMNAPTGFEWSTAEVTKIDPMAAMLNPASLQQVIHMTLAAYVATGFAVAAVHAFLLLRDRSNVFHRRALGIALTVAAVSSPLQIVKRGRDRPDGRRAAAGQVRRDGGSLPDRSRSADHHRRYPNDATMTTRYALRIPRG